MVAIPFRVCVVRDGARAFVRFLPLSVPKCGGIGIDGNLAEHRCGMCFDGVGHGRPFLFGQIDATQTGDNFQ